MRLAKNESDARTHRTPKALNAKRYQRRHSFFATALRSVYCLPAVCGRSSRRFLAPTSGLFPIASLPRLFRGAHRSTGSGEAVAGIFAGSDGGFCAYPASTPARVVLLPQSSVAGRFPPVEALHSGPATSECDSLPLARSEERRVGKVWMCTL